MRCIRVFPIVAAAAVTAALVPGTVARGGSTEWRSVSPGQSVLTELQAPARAAINADAATAYAIASVADPRTGEVTLGAWNPEHALTATFTPDGLRTTAAGETLTLALSGYGRAGRRGPVAMHPWRADGVRAVRTSRDGEAVFTEWYLNGPLGLEQGFTIAAPPPGQGPLSIELALDEGWRAVATGDQTALRLQRASGVALAYSGLHVVDAANRTLPARLVPSPRGFIIDVEVDAASPYPITIDPFITQQTLTAFDGQNNDRFGLSVALDGNTAVIGAPFRDGGSGAAYVFVRSGSTWSLQAKLVPNDPSDKAFGFDVDISGNTVVVGAPEDDTIALRQGSAYVFVRSGTSWAQQAKLVPGGGIQNRFGTSVSVDGETVAIGSPGRGVLNQQQVVAGAVFVYVRSSTTWTKQQELDASDGVSGSLVGNAVDLEGDLILAGAPGLTFDGVPLPGAAYVFERVAFSPGAIVWFERQKLTGSPSTPLDRFGEGVALSGSRALITAPGFPQPAGQRPIPGTAILYNRSGTTLTPASRIETSRAVSFPLSMALKGSQAALGAFSQTPGETFVLSIQIQPGGGLLTEPVTPTGGGSIVGAGLALDAGLLLAGDPTAGAPGRAFVLEPLTGAPSAPVLSPPVVTGTTVDLSWTTPPGTISFRLRAGTSPGGSNAFNGDAGNVTTLKAVNVPNGSYFIRVSAVNALGESVASNEVRADVGVPGPCTAPLAPANLTRNVNGSLVSLTWTASTGATSYVVEAGSGSGLANLAVIDTGSAIPSLLANAPAGTYFVRVRAKSGCGLSATSNQVTVVVG